MPRRNLRAVLVVLAISLLCWRTSLSAKPRDEIMELYGVFVDAVEQVEANYVRSVPRKELLESALRGMLQNLDEHSTYLNETDWKQFQKEIGESYIGIGVSVVIDAETNRLKILAPLVGAPAYVAGAMAGDTVLEVDGQSTEGWSRDKAVEALQGRPGTSVKLTVLHPGAEKTETLAIQRAVIEQPSVLGDLRKPDDSWDFLIDKDAKIGYIRLGGFHQDTPEDFKKALTELKAQGMKGLVIDLRNNPGGLLTAAVEMCDMFVESGRIVSTKGRNTKEKVYDAEKGGLYDAPDAKPSEGLPIAILVNQYSASAAEILSACLQDHHRAVVVGHRTYGKGSVQNIVPLDDGDSVLKLTVATYWRPSGKNIHRFKNAKEKDEWGVSPDPGYEVNLSDTELETWLYARRDRDLISSHNPVKPKIGKDGKPEPVKPYVDKPLDKALEFVQAQIKGAKAEPPK
ncbi:MAG: C-terminal processing peptidase [Planctomycetota bacterium]|nr:C-terminal processing peptidase [Planctomycetota bacterium]